MKGGYILLDCRGLELTSPVKLTKTGIYKKVKDAYESGKPVYAVNCLWEGDPMSPISVMITKRSSGNYIATASTLQIVIDENNGVEIINMLAA